LHAFCVIFSHCEAFNLTRIDNSCNNHRYRSYDGSCNNLHHREWGTASTNYARLLPNKYSDGVHKPPVSITGNELPSSRLVSTTVFENKSDPDPDRTIVMMQFGQFVAHDVNFF
jgi:peroxidase